MADVILIAIIIGLSIYLGFLYGKEHAEYIHRNEEDHDS